MDIGGLKSSILVLRKKRYALEKRCENIGKMVPASLIMYAARHRKDESYASAQKKPYPRYAHLVYYDGAKVQHKYVRKKDMDKAILLCGNYRRFCMWMKEIRSLNRRITELLDMIGEFQSEEVEEIGKGEKGRGKGKTK